MQIGAQMRWTTVIPHFKPILNSSKSKIDMQIEMRWYIFVVFSSCVNLQR